MFNCVKHGLTYEITCPECGRATNKNKRYHIEMMIQEMKDMKYDKGTRDYLSLDSTEWIILMNLLSKEIMNITECN